MIRPPAENICKLWFSVGRERIMECVWMIFASVCCVCVLVGWLLEGVNMHENMGMRHGPAVINKYLGSLTSTHL